MFGLFKRKNEHITETLEKNQLIHFCEQTQFKNGCTLEVKQGGYAVVVNSRNILDIFPEGVYALALDRMPKLFNYLRSNNTKEITPVVKKFSAELYFINGDEVELTDLVTHKQKFSFGGEKISVKIDFNIKIKIVAPDVFLGFLLKRRKQVPDKIAEKETKKIICKDVKKATKHLPIDLTEPDYGLLSLSKLALVKLNLKKFGINVIGIKFNKFRASNKMMQKIRELSQKNKTLDVEFKRFTNAETDEVVLEKVGTESYLDKALPVDVINGGGKTEDVALLNINTGEDAQKEVVFNRLDDNNKQVSDEYLNKMDGMLLKPQLEVVEPQNEELVNVTNVTNEQNEIKRDLFCRQCGARVGANDRFCGNCGNRLNWQKWVLVC